MKLSTPTSLLERQPLVYRAPARYHNPLPRRTSIETPALSPCLLYLLYRLRRLLLQLHSLIDQNVRNLRTSMILLSRIANE